MSHIAHISIAHISIYLRSHICLMSHICLIWVEEKSYISMEVIYGLSNGMKFFDPRLPLGVKGQGQTIKTSKSNISKTVRDREMLSKEVK